MIQVLYKKNIISCLLLVLLSIMFYFLNVFTPLQVDDMLFSCFMNSNGVVGEKLNNVLDVFISQYNYYFMNNGRYWGHSLIQLFSGVLGKNLFDIFNTFQFSLFIVLFLLVIKDNRKRLNLFQVGISICLFWFLVPAFGETLLWLSGSMTYLYAIVWGLLFFLTYRRIRTASSSSLFHKLLLFLLGLFTGWSHEALGLCLSGVVFFDFIFHVKTIKNPLIPLILGLWIGTLFVSLSPGLWLRAEADVQPFSFSGLFWNIIRVTLYMKAFPILVVLTFFMAIKKRSEVLHFVSKNYIYYGFVVLSYFFCCLIGLQTVRQLFFLEIVSIILILRIFFEYGMSFSQRSMVSLSVVLFIVFIFDYIIGLQACKDDYETKMNIYEQYQNSSDGVVSTTYKRQADWLYEYKASRYVLYLMYSHKSGYINSMATWYWGTPEKKMIVLPEDIYISLYKRNEFCNLQNMSIKIGEYNSYTTSDLDFYVIPIKKEDQNSYINKSVHFVYDPSIENPLPWYVNLIRPFSKRLNPPDSFILPDAVTRLSSIHGDYMLIDKPHYIVGKVENVNLIEE